MDNNTNTRGCWYCGGALIWGGDEDLFSITEDPHDVDGILTNLTCSECGASVEYLLSPNNI